MPVRRLAEMTWEETAAIDRDRAVAILPVGATEAHGPHLPLSTDVIIAEAMALNGAERLAAHGWEALLLPPIAYSVARYAAGFAGTVSIRPQTAAALIEDVVREVARHGIARIAIANAHLEPAHIASIDLAVERLAADPALTPIFPDVTKKPWALRLGDEFRSGACHAGRYEGSIVMAARPELVREELRRGLEPNPVSLSRAIREGKTTFEQAGGARAYFGAPAAASREEGLRSIEVLGEILCEAVLGAQAGSG